MRVAERTPGTSTVEVYAFDILMSMSSPISPGTFMAAMRMVATVGLFASASIPVMLFLVSAVLG